MGCRQGSKIHGIVSIVSIVFSFSFSGGISGK